MEERSCVGVEELEGHQASSDAMADQRRRHYRQGFAYEPDEVVINTSPVRCAAHATNEESKHNGSMVEVLG